MMVGRFRFRPLRQTAQGHDVAENFEAPVAQQIFDGAAGSGGQIIDPKNVVAVVEQPTAKMCPEKARAPGN